MALLPTILVEISFVSAPDVEVPTWVDVTDYVEGWTIGRGRGDEDGQAQPGKLTLRLDNTDGRFDPENTAGAYYPNVLPLRQVRVSVTHDGTTYRRFRGHVERWPRTWPGGSTYSTTTVTCVDALALFARRQAPTAYSVQVLADDPIAYYPMNEAAGLLRSQNLGTLGVTADGYYSTPLTTRVAGPFNTPDLAVLFSPSLATGGITLPDLDEFSRLDDITMECWAYCVADTPGVIVDLSPVSGGRLYFDAHATAGLVTIGYETQADLVPTGASTSTSLAAWHHLVMVRRSNAVTFFVDGVATAATAMPRPNGTDVGFVPAIASGGLGTIDGYLRDVAIYDKALPAERVSAHYASRADTFPAAPAGERVADALDAMGWSATRRELDPGAQRLADKQVAGGAYGAVLTSAVDSDQGLLYVDGRGYVVFHDGHHRISRATSTTSQATFGDDAGEVPYEDTYTSDFSLDELENVATVSTATGQSAAARDAASIAAYFEAGDSHSTELDGLPAAQATADWIVHHGKTPMTRLNDLTIDPLADTATMTQALARELSDRVTVTRRPAIGSTVTRDVYLESLNETVNFKGDVSWRVTYTCSPALAGTYIVVDTASALVDTTATVAF